MKRRQFITSAAAGLGGFAVSGCSTRRSSAPYTGPGFDVHPFVKAHPEAVFIARTSVSSKKDTQQIHDTAYSLADELIVRTESGGYSPSTKILCKPNWTCNPPVDGKSAFDQRGINTDMHFVEGFLKAVRTKGPEDIFLRECACPQHWEVHGWTQMAKRNNFDMRDLSSRDYWDLKEGRDIRFVKVNDGVFFKEIGFQTPTTANDMFLLNIAKFKAHGMGITGAVKNLQGLTGRRFHNYCTPYKSIRKQYSARYHKFFQDDFEQRIEELYASHLIDGIPRWDRPNDNNRGGIWQEMWAQRTCDALSVLDTGLNMVEGIYGRDGNGFANGPHNGKGKDYMANIVVFGLDPFKVDIITHWLGGHEPGNFGLFHIAIERGLTDVLDPFDIPIYEWKNGQASLTSLETFERTPLVTYYLTRDYNGQNEPEYHLVNEPFDYSSWKKNHQSAGMSPSIGYNGCTRNGYDMFEVVVPDKSPVDITIRDRNRRIIWQEKHDVLKRGANPVYLSEGFSQRASSISATGRGWHIIRDIIG